MVDLWWGHHLSEVLEEFLEGLEDWLKVWEHHDHWVHVLVLLIEFLDGFLHLNVESMLLDVLSLDRLIPLVVESSEGGGKLSQISVESVDLRHKLHVGVAGIILSVELEDIEQASDDLEEVVEKSLLKVLHEDALGWVLDAPVLGVILNSLEIALIKVLVDGINHISTDLLDIVDGDGPEVLVKFLLELMDTKELWLHPLSEALVRDGIVVLLVPSLQESSVNVLQQKSVGLGMVKSWNVGIWAVFGWLEHAEKWLVLEVAGINGSDSAEGGVLVHFDFFKLIIKN